MYCKITGNCFATGIPLPKFLGQTRNIFSSGVGDKIWGELLSFIIITCIIYFLWCLTYILSSYYRKLFISLGYSFHQVGERLGWSLMKFLYFMYSRDFIQGYIHQTYIRLFLLLVAFQYLKLVIYYWMYLGSFSLMFTFSYLYLFQLESLITIKMVIG